MNKSRMKKNAWSHVRLRPVAKRFYGADGPQLPPVDDDWMITGVEDKGVSISNNHTGHGTTLGWAGGLGVDICASLGADLDDVLCRSDLKGSKYCRAFVLL
jgi:hypothetical protein